MLDKEKFEGFWGLPDSSQEIAGSLIFDPNTEITLTLMGNFGQLSTSKSRGGETLIHGITLNGTKITLVECLLSGRSSSKRGIENCTYLISRVMIGIHLESEDPEIFCEASVEIEHLHIWLNTFNRSISSSEENGPLPQFKQLPPVEFTISSEYIGKFVFGYTYEENNERLILSQLTKIDILPISNCTTLNIIKCVWTFQKFLSLACDENVYLKKFVLVINQPNPIECFLPKAEVRVLYIQRKRAAMKRKVVYHDFLFRYDEIENKFRDIIAKWYENDVKISPVLEILNDSHSKETFTETNFISIVQALEAFHRRLRQDTPELKGKHSEWLQAILEKLEDDDVKILKGRLEFAYEPALSRRLKELIQEFDDTALVKLFGDSKGHQKRFVQKTIETRNYFTHYDETKKDAIWKMKELYYVTEKLKILLFCSVLSECSFTLEEINAILLNWGRFHFLKNN